MCSSDLPVAPLALLALKPGFDRLKHRFDYEQYGGAPLLGVRGVSIVTHGRARARMFENAIRVASEAATARWSGVASGSRHELLRSAGDQLRCVPPGDRRVLTRPIGDQLRDAGGRSLRGDSDRVLEQPWRDEFRPLCVERGRLQHSPDHEHR